MKLHPVPTTEGYRIADEKDQLVDYIWPRSLHLDFNTMVSMRVTKAGEDPAPVEFVFGLPQAEFEFLVRLPAKIRIVDKHSRLFVDDQLVTNLYFNMNAVPYQISEGLPSRYYPGYFDRMEDFSRQANLMLVSGRFEETFQFQCSREGIKA